MATRKSFVELAIPETAIARGSNTVGGTVIGDYIQDGKRVVVVKMPKVEKKPVKKPVAKKKGPVAKLVEEAVARQEQPQEVTRGA